MYKTNTVFSADNFRPLSQSELVSIAFRVKFIYAFYQHPIEMLMFVDEGTAKKVRAASNDFAKCIDRMMHQLIEFKDMRHVDRDTVKGFGHLLAQYLNVFRVFNLIHRPAAAADILKTVRSLSLAEEILSDQHHNNNNLYNYYCVPNTIAAAIRKLRVRYADLTTEPNGMKLFDDTLESVRKSQTILHDMEFLHKYYEVTEPEINHVLTRLRNHYIAENGPRSLDFFDKRWLSDTTTESARKLCEIRRTAGEGGDTTMIWRDFKRKMSHSYFIVNRIRMNIEYVGTMRMMTRLSLPEDDKVIRRRPENCTWAKFGIDIVPSTTTTIMQEGFLAKAIFKPLVDFSYKSKELLFTTTTATTTTVLFLLFDLGDAFPQFRNCTMVWFMHHGLEAMAIVQTHFSSYMIFTSLSSSAYNSMHISSANTTVRLTVEQKRDPTTIISTPSGIAIVELKLCACCGKSAEQKCGHCWRTNNICIRYCSKACTVQDRPRHARVCGRDFSDEWKPAAAVE